MLCIKISPALGGAGDEGLFVRALVVFHLHAGELVYGECERAAFGLAAAHDIPVDCLSEPSLEFLVGIEAIPMAVSSAYL